MWKQVLSEQNHGHVRLLLCLFSHQVCVCWATSYKGQVYARYNGEYRHQSQRIIRIRWGDKDENTGKNKLSRKSKQWQSHCNFITNL